MPTIEELQAELEASKEALDTTRADLAKRANEAAYSKRKLDELESLSKFKGMDFDEVQESLSKLSQFDGIDDELIEQAIRLHKQAKDAEEEQLLKTGGIDAVVERRTKALKDTMGQEVQELKELVQGLQTETVKANDALKDYKLRSELSAAVSKAKKFIQGAERFLFGVLKDHSDYDEDGNLVFSINGEQQFSSSDGKLMGLEEFVEFKMPDLVPELTLKSTGSNTPGDLGDKSDDKDNPFITGDGLAQAKLRDDDLQRAKRLLQRAKDLGKAKVKISL